MYVSTHNMSSTKDAEEYYQTIMLLQEKLRQSEEERLNLEIKYNEIIQHIKEEEEAHLKKIRFKYKQFLEEDRRRQQRNDKILDALDRIENRSKMWEAKTKKFKAFRNRYQDYLKAGYEIDDCDDVFKSCLQSNIYSTNSNNVKPEDKYSNLGNVNSIYSKTLKKIEHDNNKTSKDLENSLKQAVKPCTTPYLTRLETDRIEENYWEKSAEQVHNDLKRLLNEEKKISLINKFRPTEVALPNEASPTKTEESIILNVNQKNCVESIKLTSSTTEPEIVSKAYNLENQTCSKKEESKVDDRKHIIETISNEFEMPGEKQRRYEKVTSPKTALIEKNRKIDYDKIEAELNQKSAVHEQTFELNGVDVIPIQTVKTPNEKDSTSTKNLNVTEVAESDDVIPKTINQYCTLQTETAIEGESGEYVSDQTIREQIDEDRQNLEDDKKIEEVHYETESQIENVTLQPQLNEQNEQISQMYDENRHFPEQCDDNNVNVKHYKDSDQTILQYDENGQPIPQYDQPYQEYDGNYYDENQTQQQYYNQQEQYQYDENGQLIQQYDEHGQSLQQYYNNELLQYDENGQPILQYDQNALYDENGQMLQYNSDQRDILQYDDYNTGHGEQLNTRNNEIEQVVSESVNENIVQSPLGNTNLESAIN